MTPNEAGQILAHRIMIAIVETVRETQDQGPVPESPIWMAIEKSFPSMTLDKFQLMIQCLVAAKVLQRGPSHTLTASKV